MLPLQNRLYAPSQSLAALEVWERLYFQKALSFSKAYDNGTAMHHLIEAGESNEISVLAPSRMHLPVKARPQRFGSHADTIGTDSSDPA
jgi:hypothetical protein